MMRNYKALTLVLAGAAYLWSAAAQANEGSCDMTQDRYERGLERLDEITQGQGQAVAEALSRTSPDLTRYIIEYGYGEVFCRPGLTDKQRELAVISALAAMGYPAPELRVHIHAALNVGASREEVVETMIVMSVYAGFPASIHGVKAAEAVFAERDAKEGASVD